MAIRASRRHPLYACNPPVCRGPRVSATLPRPFPFFPLCSAFRPAGKISLLVLVFLARVVACAYARVPRSAFNSPFVASRLRSRCDEVAARIVSYHSCFHFDDFCFPLFGIVDYIVFFFFFFLRIYVVTQFGERMMGCEIGGKVRFLMIEIGL